MVVCSFVDSVPFSLHKVINAQEDWTKYKQYFIKCSIYNMVMSHRLTLYCPSPPPPPLHASPSDSECFVQRVRYLCFWFFFVLRMPVCQFAQPVFSTDFAFLPAEGVTKLWILSVPPSDSQYYTRDLFTAIQQRFPNIRMSQGCTIIEDMKARFGI